MNKVLIKGFDVHGNPIEEWVELNGTEPVETKQEFRGLPHRVVIVPPPQVTYSYLTVEVEE